MITDELKQRVKEQIGYINAFRRGLYDVISETQEDAPPGWMVTNGGWHSECDNPNAVRLGQVKVHHGDPHFKIYAVPHWLGVVGAVEFYGIKKSTLTKALRAGEITDAKKQGGKWRFRLLALLEWDATMQKRAR